MEHVSIDDRIQLYMQRAYDIRINVDASTYELRCLEKDLDDLQTDILFDYSDIRAQYQDIQRSIEVITKTNISGTNDYDRRASGLNAARSVTQENEDGTTITINLFQIESDLRRKFFLLQDIFSLLRDKSQRIVTLRSTLKIEEELIAR